MLKNLVTEMDIIHAQMGNFKRKMETTDIKQKCWFFGEFIIRLDTAGERIGELQDRSVKLLKLKRKEGKKSGKKTIAYK